MPVRNRPSQNTCLHDSYRQMNDLGYFPPRRCNQQGDRIPLIRGKHLHDLSKESVMLDLV